MAFEEHASVAKVVWGSYFAVGASTSEPLADPSIDVFDNVSEVVEGTPPNEQGETAEVTHWGSPDRTKEFIAALIDAGEATIRCNWNPENYDNHRRIVQLKKSGQKRNMRFVLTEGMETIDFPGFVKGIGRVMGGAGEPITADVTIQVAGAVVSDRETT